MHPGLKAHFSPMAIAAYVVVIASIALRPAYPKSIDVGIFIGCAMIATYGSWICFGGWRRSTSASQRRLVLMLLTMFLGLAAYGGYISLGRILS